MSSASDSQAYQCELPLDREVTSYRKTKIVCTIGPACANVETLKQMIKNGMCIARLNFSHGTYDVHKGFIKLVRQAAAETGEKIAIALDTKGPEIRTGATVGNQNITVTRDQTLIISTDDKHKEACCSEVIYVDYKFLARDVKPGQTILIADGVGVLTVKEIVNSTDVKCVSSSEFSIGSKKNVCLPGVAIDLPALAPKDVEDIKFGMAEGVDIIFASFIRNASNVKELRNLLMSQESGKNIKIISKIENFEGVTKIDEIIEAGDGIMVARGDLGMDLRAELLISAQKMIMDRCNCASKPVICATQMMESMIKNPRPTRAEISDVYNAVLDGADAVMLSGESANGQYPSVVVEFMHKISQYSESTICRLSLHEKIRKCFHCKCRSTSSSGCCIATPCRVLCGLAISAADLALSVCASAIICVSTTGKIPRLISGARPHCPIILVTCNEQIARQGHLHCGVVPYHCAADVCKGKIDSVLNDAVKFGIEKGVISSSCPQVVIVTGSEHGDEKTDGLRVASVDISGKKLQ